MWKSAHDAGLKVYFRTDMLDADHAARGVPRSSGSAASTPRTPSSGTSTPPASTSSTRTMPYVDGVLIRIGEAGSVYDLPGWDYYLRARA